MIKIPVSKVISESVSFAIRKYFSLLGVVWLPMLISLVFTWFVMFPHFKADATSAGGLSPARSFLTSFAMEFVQLALMAVMSVGVTKEALGLREGPRFVYLSVGTAELRVFGGYVLLAVFTVVVGIVLAIVGGLAVELVAGGPRATNTANPAAIPPIMAIVMPLVIFGILLPMLYFWIRLSSFQTAVSVLEQRFGLWRSWTLSRGNFWRLIAIVMVIWIPLLVLEAIALGVTMGPVFTKMIAAASAGPEALRAAQREALAFMMSNLKYAMFAFLPLAPIFDGLIIAPGAFAYRALVPSASESAATFE